MHLNIHEDIQEVGSRLPQVLVLANVYHQRWCRSCRGRRIDSLGNWMGLLVPMLILVQHTTSLGSKESVGTEAATFDAGLSGAAGNMTGTLSARLRCSKRERSKNEELSKHFGDGEGTVSISRSLYFLEDLNLPLWVSGSGS